MPSLVYLHLNVPLNGLIFPGFSVFWSFHDYVNFSHVNNNNNNNNKDDNVYGAVIVAQSHCESTRFM